MSDKLRAVIDNGQIKFQVLRRNLLDAYGEWEDTELEVCDRCDSVVPGWPNHECPIPERDEY